VQGRAIKDGRVTFGLFITAIHPRGEDLAQRLAEHREQVTLVREVGFTSIAAGQHFITQPLQMPATVPYLTSLAEISGRMRLVIGVALLPLMNPVLLAEDVATLDWLSDGRVVLGLGIGYRPAEFAAMGVATRDRVGRFNETLAVMRAIWSAEDRWSFHGRYYNFDDLPGGLKPKQHPHPLLWVAADVDNAVRRAARLGAAWYINPRAKLASLKEQLQVFQEALAESGNPAPAEFPIRREAFIARTDQEARTMAVRYLRRMLEIYEAWGQYEVMPGADERDRTFGEDDIPDTYLVGTPDRVGDLIQKYNEELGVNHFVLRMQWPGMPHRDVMSSIELLGENLVPRFSRLS
jgi:alkanesulfonate monooxygenase SsuD/methylene tetrahydromethanopterin reductase-like flavin-dependent oxidoreductase (luciferase family)